VPMWASVPLDPAIKRAERAGVPLVAGDPSSPARRAVARLVDQLEQAGAPAEAVRGA
jgi:MinD-like ATPase involved in chromosome partitioning or flagellar assembly